MRNFTIKRRQLASSLILVIVIVVCKVYLLGETQEVVIPEPEASAYESEVIVPQDFTLAELRLALVSKKLQRISRSFSESRDLENLRQDVPNYNVHIFYYAWYRTNSLDGYYSHWFFTKDFSGPNNTLIDSYYFPKLGLYSSCDDSIVNLHFYEISKSGIGVVLIWWTFEEEVYHLMQLAHTYSLKVALHVHIPKGSNIKKVFKSLKKFIDRTTGDPTYYKILKNGRELPVFYIHSSFDVDWEEWKHYLDYKGSRTIRNTTHNGVFIGSIQDKHHINHIRRSRFDGFYTFLASNGHTYSSSWKNWDSLASFAEKNNLIFSPSVSPGYVARHDWLNEENIKRDRAHGQYYDVAWRTAINNAKFVSINSFNDWNSGTQIEPAQFINFEGNSYFGYEPKNPDFYMNLTNWWVAEFTSLAA